MYLFRIFLKILLIGFTKCYNLDFEYTVAKNGPANSLFGFSVAEHQDLSNPGSPQNWMLVGAPQASNQFLDGTYSDAGTVFKCDPSDPSFNCTAQVPFDKKVDGSAKEDKSKQWLGVSLVSGGMFRSVVTCAHRYQFFGKGGEFQLLEGKCHLLGETLDGTSTSFSACTNENIDRSTTPNHERYGQCLSGVGLQILPEADDEDDDAIIVGAPGTKWLSGEMFKMDTADRQTYGMLPENFTLATYQDSYFGYALAYGNFLEKDSLQFASGGPHHQHSGKILIYSQKADKVKINLKTTRLVNKILQEIPGSSAEKVQIASGFGIALCAIDSDNNGLSELVVGAPFYLLRGAKDRPENGIVYIYEKADGEAKLALKKTLQGEAVSYSNFGYAVANGGDLDMDGYEDLVVGAPREDDNAGAIYVYYGSKGGINEGYRQRIAAKSVHSGLTDDLGFQGFGRSIGAGLDLDNNGYNDVLVGAYISSQVALLRSRPVLRVKSGIDMKFEPNKINANEEKCGHDLTIAAPCTKVELCVNISEASGKLKSKGQTVRLKFNVEADLVRIPRVKFVATGTNTHSFVVATDDFAKCEKLGIMYMLKDEYGQIAEYPDIRFKVTYAIPYGDPQVPKPARSLLKVPSLDAYPILENIVGEAGSEFQLNFTRDNLGDGVPDLSVTSKQKKFTLRMRTEDNEEFPFNVTVENKGDTAYSLDLRVNVPPTLQFNDVRLVDENRLLSCSDGFCQGFIYKLKGGAKKTLRITLGTDLFDPLKQNNISIIVVSANQEGANTTSDNKLDILFDMKIESDVQLLARAVTQGVAFQGEIKGETAMTSLESIGAFVNHTYAIKNNGPDMLLRANLTIKWPYQTISGKHLLYLVSVSNPDCVVSNANVLNLKSDGTTAPSQSSQSASPVVSFPSVKRKRVRREIVRSNDTFSADEGVTGKVSTRKKEGVILDCMSNTADCIEIKCSVVEIPKGSAVTVAVNARLWEPSLLLDYYADVVTIVSHGSVILGKNASYISDPVLTNGENEAYTVVTPVFAPKSKDKIEMWQIALAVVAGVILLALMIFGLYKVGFFKRKRSYDEADKKLLDKK